MTFHFSLLSWLHVAEATQSGLVDFAAEETEEGSEAAVANSLQLICCRLHRSISSKLLFACGGIYSPTRGCLVFQTVGGQLSVTSGLWDVCRPPTQKKRTSWMNVIIRVPSGDGRRRERRWSRAGTLGQFVVVEIQWKLCGRVVCLIKSHTKGHRFASGSSCLLDRRFFMFIYDSMSFTRRQNTAVIAERFMQATLFFFWSPWSISLLCEGWWWASELQHQNSGLTSWLPSAVRFRQRSLGGKTVVCVKC